MTIDEAIKHCEEVTENQLKQANAIDKLNCDSTSIRNMAEYHRQLAEWLKELKKYRAIFVKIGELLGEYGYTMDDLDTIFGKVMEEVKADDE